MLPETAERFGVAQEADPNAPNGVRYELELDGKATAMPEGARATLESIIQDPGEIPPAFLVAAGAGLYRRGLAGDDVEADSVWSGTYHEKAMRRP